MEFTIQDLTVITGLTRGQIDQAISRHGFKPMRHSVLLGQRRPFTRPDAVALSVAAALRGFQIDWNFVAKVLTNSFLAHDVRGFIDVLFPPAADTVDSEEPAFVVVQTGDISVTGVTVFAEGNPTRPPLAEIATLDQVRDWIAKGRTGGQCILVDLSAILHRVDQHSSTKRAAD